MRCGIRGCGCALILNENDEFLAVSLGKDFAAEHEWGISDMLIAFKAKGSGKKIVYGLEKDLITLNSIKYYSIKDEGNDFFVITSHNYPINSITQFQDNLYQCKTSKGDIIDMWSAWDRKDFILVFKDTLAAKKVYESIIRSFKKKDIVLTLSDMRSYSGGSGLHIVKYSRIPKFIIEDKIARSKHVHSIEKAFKTHPTIIRLGKVKEDWRRQYGVHDTPYDALALVPKGDSISDISIWLNPCHQSHLNCGWLSFKDIDNWIDGVPGAVIKSCEHWDELKYICSRKGYSVRSIANSLPYFVGDCNQEIALPTNPNDMSVQLKPCAKGKLSKDTIRRIASVVKYEVRSDIRTQMFHKSFDAIQGISRHCDEYIMGFFKALSLLGYGYYGACNTPAEYENICWFKDILIDEAFWDVMVERGEAYAPWVKTKTSFYHKKYKKNN